MILKPNAHFGILWWQLLGNIPVINAFYLLFEEVSLKIETFKAQFSIKSSSAHENKKEPQLTSAHCNTAPQTRKKEEKQ